jgi:heme-degrading monooxygenase HmoA
MTVNALAEGTTMNSPTMPMGEGTTAAEAGQPIVLINTFTPKPGRLDEFIRTQVVEAARLGEDARRMGWLGNRIYRTHDGQTAVIVTMFESAAAQARWAASAAFAEHRKLIEPMLESVESTPCELVASNGDI